MSEKKPETARGESDDHNDASVAAYLSERPDFFTRHPEVLARLEIKHDAHGAVSLLEKQVAVLRNKNSGAEIDRAELIKLARANANLSTCLHETALELLRNCTRPFPSRAAKAGRILQTCKTVFERHVPEVSLFIYWLHGFLADETRSDDVIVLDEKDQRVSTLVKSLFAAGEFHCEPLDGAARAALFGRFAPAIRSSLAATLFEPVTHGRMGVLVLTSGDTSRFTPGKGTMFLVQLAQLIESPFYPAAGTGSEAEDRSGKGRS